MPSTTTCLQQLQLLSTTQTDAQANSDGGESSTEVPSSQMMTYVVNMQPFCEIKYGSESQTSQSSVDCKQMSVVLRS